MLTQDAEALGWKNICQDEGCIKYHPINHSHQFNLYREKAVNCPECSKEMKLDAQAFRSEWGQNKCELINHYICECGSLPKVDNLYTGQNNGYKNIYEEAKKSL